MLPANLLTAAATLSSSEALRATRSRRPRIAVIFRSSVGLRPSRGGVVGLRSEVLTCTAIQADAACARSLLPAFGASTMGLVPVPNRPKLRLAHVSQMPRAWLRPAGVSSNPDRDNDRRDGVLTPLLALRSRICFRFSARVVFRGSDDTGLGPLWYSA